MPPEGLGVRQMMRSLRGKFPSLTRFNQRPPRPGAVRAGRMRATSAKRLERVWREVDAAVGEVRGGGGVEW